MLMSCIRLRHDSFPTLLDFRTSFDRPQRCYRTAASCGAEAGLEFLQMATEYLPVLVTFALAGIVVLAMVGLGRLLGPKSRNPVKQEAFECGNPASGPAWGRFSVKFYMTAILFIVFDIEVVFMYPWAVVFRRLGWFGFAEMIVFIGVLTIGLVYVWRKGALEWD